MIYFTADLHFGHSNIIKYCKRPFECADEMREVLIGNWNSIVKPMDTVYVLGDFAMGDPRPYLKRLYGDIYLIPGDHDSVSKWPKDYVLPKIYSLCYQSQHIVLCHYPILAWPRSHYGSWHLHGHCHKGTLPFRPGKIINVGVDDYLNCFYPVSWTGIVNYMKGRPDNWNSVVGKKTYPHL